MSEIEDGGPAFPILQSKFGAPREYVSWADVAPHERQAMRNHDGQTLRRLAGRGGLSWGELFYVLRDEEFPFRSHVTNEDAKPLVLAMLAARKS